MKIETKERRYTYREIHTLRIAQLDGYKNYFRTDYNCEYEKGRRLQRIENIKAGKKIQIKPKLFIPKLKHQSACAVYKKGTNYHIREWE